MVSNPGAFRRRKLDEMTNGVAGVLRIRLPNRKQVL